MPDSNTSLTGLYECLLTEKQQEELQGLELSLTNKLINNQLLAALFRRHAEQALRRAIAEGLGEIESSENTQSVALMLQNALSQLQGLPDNLKSPLVIPPVLLEAADVSPSPSGLAWSKVIRPASSFSQTTLFTGAQGEPSLVEEMRREIASANEIDWLVSFVKWSGLNPLFNALEEFTQRGGKLRIATTTYMGATDAKAILRLARLPNTEIYVSYDSKTTRHHAKTYIFRRPNGLSTAYTGSANLSKAALSYGLEWTVKITESTEPEVLDRMNTIFEAYVTDLERFERFDPERDRDRFIDAIDEARAFRDGKKTEISSFHHIAIRPYPYQQDILDKLRVARLRHNETRSLIVAATGTGKTMIAAFDYRDRAQQLGRREKLLFIAHRQEILKQALSSFRFVLNDQNFGELHVGDARASEGNFVFMSVQLASKLDAETLKHFEYVVIDEFHHAHAQSYRNLLSKLDPEILLGMTATPQRGDGVNVAEFFGNRITAELSLASAIDQQLLVPFDYFMVSDPVSLQSMAWRSGDYDTAELERAYTEGKSALERDNAILSAIDRYLPDLNQVKGIAFCASRKHAAHMAEVFNHHGIKAQVVDGETKDDLREAAPEKLLNGELQFVCTVDVYNEGVDIPSVNTVLFLRPTASITVFTQQLGRGLRLFDDKEKLTVLDFVGAAKNEFSFESRLAALKRPYSGTSFSLVMNPQANMLPLGCTLTFERVAMQHVLENLKVRRFKRDDFLQNLRDWAYTKKDHEITFEAFLAHRHMRASEWVRMLKDNEPIFFRDFLAQVLPDRFNAPTFEGALKLSSRKAARIFQKNGYEALQTLVRTLHEKRSFSALTTREKATWVGFAYDWMAENVKELGGNMLAAQSLYEALIRDELCNLTVSETLQALANDVDFISPPSPLSEEIPLELHASYPAKSALGAFGCETAYSLSAGVMYAKSNHGNADFFFVTIDKDEKLFGLTTRYDDYAMNERHFHWQSQSKTSLASTVGQRYCRVDFTDEAPQAHLFVRRTKKEGSVTPAFVYLGRVRYVKHEGECPISFVWELETPMTAALLTQFSKLSL